MLLTDRAFSGSDASAIACGLGYAIKKLGDFDLILCGRGALDSNTLRQALELLNSWVSPRLHMFP